MSSVKTPSDEPQPGRHRRDRTKTRARMVYAARRLFIERGYAATTIPEIAAAAGVAVPTIYWAFGSKRAIVSEIRRAWFEAAETGARLREVLAIDEPGARLEAYAAFMGNQWATGAEALAIQQDAMRADPEIAAEITAVLAERAERLKAVVVPLAPELREPLSVETAHDILLALSLLEVYRELRGRGWTDAQYRAWLGDVLREQLLVSDAAKTNVSPPDDSPPRTT
jgi:AcrR family transcriptional regulator